MTYNDVLIFTVVRLSFGLAGLAIAVLAGFFFGDLAEEFITMFRLKR